MRRLRTVLKIAWAALAWLLYLSGVIGCGAGSHRAGPDWSADAGPDLSDPRPVFVAYLEEASSDFPLPTGTREVTNIVGDGVFVAPACTGEASSAEIAAFIDVATSPDVVAEFSSKTSCPLTADGSTTVTLSYLDRDLLQRSVTCSPVVRALADAHELVAAACARADAGANTP
jgi:hypothetical protein